ncbi:MAG: primosomal protein N' [Burkholderiaceae bacterium]|nr:primosomal protein N' [Burkholderiaceae bacterium]
MSASAERTSAYASAQRPGYVRVALDVPAAQLGVSLFDYAVPEGCAAQTFPVGTWVVVPWGRGRRIGLVAGWSAQPDIDAARVRPVERVLGDAPVLPAAWFDLVEFAARYYHRGAGEVAMPAIPKLLRTMSAAGGGAGRESSDARAGASAPEVRAGGRVRRARTSAFDRARARWQAPAERVPPPADEQPAPGLTDAQRGVLDALRAEEGFAVHLLHGVTGSGKTEVYLHWLAEVLARDASAQVLLLVPEIALTPRLHAQLVARFPRERVALLHSEMADAERAAHWLAVAEGRARVVLGTRLAVLAPFPALAAIVVDEEHDSSYKQQEGVRYSARDLAIAAASQRRVPIVLGSATPSLETWFAARRGRYRSHALRERIGNAVLPAVECVDLSGAKLRHSLAPRVLEAIEATLGRGEQALVFVNRRGYAPVLSCAACGWLSRCANCSAYRVLHRIAAAPGGAATDERAVASRASRYRLVCHHCAAEQPVPRACPDCGNVDLDALGRGTQRLEESLAELFPRHRIARLDRDVARRRGAAQRVLDAAHAGEVDLLVGTQMLAKGHDFRRLALVVALDVDAGLYAADFRAPERLFATLMQVAGRAGRSGGDSRMIVQTRYPGHPLFAFLARHDYAGFADRQLAERRETGLPPYRHQAMLRAEARQLADALAFLEAARALASGREASDEVSVFDAVPMSMSRLQGRERAQLLVESVRRASLHRFLADWLAALRATAPRVSWQLDVDPLEI